MTTEPEVLAARRAFPAAQLLLAGIGASGSPQRLSVGWYDTSVDPERGSFAVVALDGIHQGLVGEIVAVRYRHRTVYAYVLGARTITTDVALQRRAFLGLAAPSVGRFDADVEVVL